MYKRMLCLVLAGVLLMSLLPIASADDGGVVLFDTQQSESSPAPESAPVEAAASAAEVEAPSVPESAPVEAAAAPAPEVEAPPAPEAAAAPAPEAVTPPAPEAAAAPAPEAATPPAPEAATSPAPEAVTPPAPENEVRMILPDQPQEAGYVTYEFVVEDRVVEVQIVGDGEVLTQPATPEAPEGRRFTGWLDEEGRPFRSFGPPDGSGGAGVGPPADSRLCAGAARLVHERHRRRQGRFHLGDGGGARQRAHVPAGCGKAPEAHRLDAGEGKPRRGAGCLPVSYRAGNALLSRRARRQMGHV